MRNWKEIDINQMRNDAQLWAEFRNDYLLNFGEKINPNCKKNYVWKFKKLINKKNKKMENKNTAFVLKKKYNGISFFGKIYRNGDLTDEKAMYLLKKHPAKDKLFDKVPKELPEVKETESKSEFAKWTVPDIKAELDRFEIEYKANDKKDVLVALLDANAKEQE